MKTSKRTEDSEEKIKKNKEEEEDRMLGEERQLVIPDPIILP